MDAGGFNEPNKTVNKFYLHGTNSVLEGLRHCLCFIMCVFYYCRTYYKVVRVGKRRVEDMYYERRRAEACVDESIHHALVNAGGREIV